MKLTARLMEHSQAYRLWQAPFVERKFAPILAHNDLRQVRRVLDVGCGPGTNTRYFAGADYLGIDRNASCVEYARRLQKRDFIVADVTTYTVASSERFDFILLNSFLHHVDTPNARRILTRLASLLTDDGYVHILDLVLPERPSLARWLARMDRGRYPRPLEELLELVNGVFDSVVFEPYTLTALGVTLWKMVYFKGRAQR